MSEGNSLIDFGDLSKPANTLIEKVSEAVGGVFKPWQLKRVAKAEAEVERIKSISRIQTTELEHRALQRFMVEEAKKQSNIENITAQSLSHLSEGSKPEEMEQDWIVNFFDKCRLVSDKEMQGIWARILAGEANTPGRFSKRTVNFMESLDKQDAQLFTMLCAFNWVFGDDIHPLIYDINAKIYIENGIHFAMLKHLDAIGLISLECIAGYKRQQLPQYIDVNYKSINYVLQFPKEIDNNLGIGKVLLTSIGEELSSICVTEPITAFDIYIIEEWKKQGIMTIANSK
jgi:hypothetical protein